MAAVEAVGIGFRTCTMGGVCVDTDGRGGGTAPGVPGGKAA